MNNKSQVEEETININNKNQKKKKKFLKQG